METTLKKPRRGPKLKHDFSNLKMNQSVALKGKAKKYPNAYISAWNKNKNNKTKVELVRDADFQPYAKRIK